VGRLIAGGTGYAHHQERRRTQEDILADELKSLESSLEQSVKAASKESSDSNETADKPQAAPAN
jgi:hypothetical protein